MKRSTGTPVNLLPLLDVLLCTMGTLIVVLGVLNRLARTRTESEQHEAAAIAREQITLHIEQLSAAREKTLTDLETERRRLAGIEDHRRQLTDRLKDLDALGRNVTADPSVGQRRDAIKSEIMRLRSESLQLEKDLQAARGAAGQKKLVFSIVPFDGVFHTNRRPIYIECRGDAVILQPEGIVFTPTDFMGPGGPGNPLASALRAAQEYWRQIPPPAPDIPNEPYPLLVVRPDGIIAYYLVRDAMQAWNAEFGYELVASDAKLEFPQAPEPRLAEMEKQAVVDARQRLQWLAQVSPEAFDRRQKAQYRVSAIRGGLVREGAPALGNDPFADDSLGGFGKSGAVGGGGNNTGSELAVSPSGSATSGMADVRGNSALGDGRAGGSGLSQGGGSTSGGPFAGGAAGSPFGQGSGANGEMPSRGSALGDGTGGPGGSMYGTGGGMVEGGTRGSGLGFNNGGGGGNPLGDPNGGLRGNGSTSGGVADGGTTSGMAGGQSALAANGPSLGATGEGNGNESGGRGTASGSMAGGAQSQAGGRNPVSGFGEYKSGAMAAGDSSSQYGGTILPGGSSAWNGSASGHSGTTPGGSTGGSGSFAESSTSGGSPGGNGGASSSSSSASASGSPSMGSSGDPSQMSMGAPSPSLNFNANDPSRKSARKLANERGRNWALSNNTTSSVAITRPIRVECWNDRLVLLPDARDQQAQVIPLADRTDQTVDQLVSAVRSHTQAWGLAGKSMYWKPQLMLDVKPDAQSRAADLQVLLADSGLDVKRK